MVTAIVVPFTNNRKQLDLAPPILSGTAIPFSSTVIYFRVILDRKLIWKEYLVLHWTNATAALWTIKRF